MRNSLHGCKNVSLSFKGTLAVSYEPSNESRESLNDAAAFLYQMSTYYCLLKKNSARWSWLFSVFTVSHCKHLLHFNATVRNRVLVLESLD
jgi:hypothetical protein